MTLDERLNQLEDEIRNLKQTINHNNKVSRALNQNLKSQLTDAFKQIQELKTQSTAKNAGMDDIFSGSPFNVRTK